MPIQKSSRHSKITGDFGEALVLYWLSKHGFECARIDHTGIDLIARDLGSDRVLGISVKSRSRSEGQEGKHLNLRKDHFEKIEAACAAFDCTPYIAIVADEGRSIRALLVSLGHALELCPGGDSVSAWQMSDRAWSTYCTDPEIRHCEFFLQRSNW